MLSFGLDHTKAKVLFNDDCVATVRSIGSTTRWTKRWQANRTGQMIHRMRQFLQKGETDRQSESINKVLEEASALALVGAKESGVVVRMELGIDLAAVIMNRILIQQVILNLIRNGIEAIQGVARRELRIATAWRKTTWSA